MVAILCIQNKMECISHAFLPIFSEYMYKTMFSSQNFDARRGREQEVGAWCPEPSPSPLPLAVGRLGKQSSRSIAYPRETCQGGNCLQ